MKIVKRISVLAVIFFVFISVCACDTQPDPQPQTQEPSTSEQPQTPEAEETMDIGSQRQVLWDDYIIDTDGTTAVLSVNHPQVADTPIFTFDAPWEGDSCDYFSIISIPQEDGSTLYRMYYNGWKVDEVEQSGTSAIKICAIESTDGINWYRPNYGLHSYEGEDNTNIVMMTPEGFDNFFVFIDQNPDCPPEQKYKAVSEYLGSDDYAALYGYTSPDGLNWTKGVRLASTAEGTFDSVNTCFYNELDGKYYLYFRGFHDSDGDGTAETRDIRFKSADSFDMLESSQMQMLEYEDDYDFALYTNNAMPYFRAPQTIMALPARYNDHGTTWTPNYDALPDAEERAQRYETNQRYATVTTDAILMISHNGLTFSRFAEAFATAGPEHSGNWLYGDCYFAYGMIQTPAEFPDQDDVLSLYSFEGKFSGEPARLYRWTIRMDGFASYKADYEGKTLLTKPLVFDGDEMYINFRTSGAGSIVIRVLDENGQEIEGFHTCELFGDSTDRLVTFEGGEISELKGQTVRLEFEMRDAEIYSFIFQ